MRHFSLVKRLAVPSEGESINKLLQECWQRWTQTANSIGGPNNLNIQTHVEGRCGDMSYVTETSWSVCNCCQEWETHSIDSCLHPLENMFEHEVRAEVELCLVDLLLNGNVQLVRKFRKMQPDRTGWSRSGLQVVIQSSKYIDIRNLGRFREKEYRSISINQIIKEKLINFSNLV